MVEERALEQIEEIWSLIAEAGYNPFVQLSAYISTNNTAYITRHGGAREQIEKVAPEMIQQFLISKM